MPNLIRQRAIEGLKVNDSFKYSRKFTHEETEYFGDITRDYIGLKLKGSKDSFVMA